MTPAEFELLVIAQDACAAGRPTSLVLDGAPTWMDPSRLLPPDRRPIAERCSEAIRDRLHAEFPELNVYGALLAGMVQMEADLWSSVMRAMQSVTPDTASESELDALTSLVGVSRR